MKFSKINKNITFKNIASSYRIIFCTPFAPKMIKISLFWSSGFIINLAIFIKPLNVKRFRSKWQSTFFSYEWSLWYKISNQLPCWCCRCLSSGRDVWLHHCSLYHSDPVGWTVYFYVLEAFFFMVLIFIWIQICRQWFYWNASNGVMYPRRLAVFPQLNFF